MRVLLFAPNAGVSLSTGGGTDFTLKLAEVLVDLGHDVELAAFHALPTAALAATFGRGGLWRSPRLTIRAESRGDLPYTVFRGLPLKTSAYAGLLWPGFDRWVEQTLRSVRADLVWFQDDVPRAARPFLNSVRYALYVHYPLAARNRVVSPPWPATAPAAERVVDSVLVRALGRVVEDPAGRAMATWANSTVTARAIGAVWPSAAPDVVPTFVTVPPAAASSERTADRLVAVGALTPSKGYVELIPWLGAARRAGLTCRLTIAGFASDPRYLRRIQRAIRTDALDELISLRTDAPRAELEALVASSAAIVHASEFEPFGLSLLEGMAFGAVPFVRRSRFSGAWTDIVEEGRWGVGFATAEELTDALRSLRDGPARTGPASEAARGRARAYSREALVGKVARLLTEVEA